MSIFKGQGQKARMKEHYDKLKTERWLGEGRFSNGEPVRNIHARHTALLGGVYMLRTFRTLEPKLLTVARYGFAPILNSTTLGKTLDTSLNVLRAGKSYGVGINQSHYPDLDLVSNPLERVTGIFSKVKDSKEILSKYGLKAAETSEHGSMREGEGGAITYAEEEFEDLIPVKFKHTGPDGDIITHQVRGAIGALTDTISPTWNETTYIGRPDGMLSYGGFSREVSFDLTLAAMNEKQLLPMWEKINRIASFVLPQLDPAAPMTRYAGKLPQVTIGGYLQNELCAMSSFTITPNEDAMWEVGDPYKDHPSLTLANRVADIKSVGKALGDTFKFKDKKSKGDQVSGAVFGDKTRRERKDAASNNFQMPRVVTINIGLKVLHNQIPGDPNKQVPLFKMPNVNYGSQGNSENPTG